MAKNLSRCCSMTKEQIVQRLNAEKRNELDLPTARNSKDNILNEFIYLKVVQVYKNDKINGRPCLSLTFSRLNLENDQVKSDLIGGILHLEKETYGDAAKRLGREMKLVVHGFRFASEQEACVDGLTVLVLDSKCPNGKIYIVNAEETQQGANVAACSKPPPVLEYATLANIGRFSDQRVNVYGVVQWFKYDITKSLKLAISDPSLLKGSTVTCTLSLDPSNKSFCLPDIRQVGDIVRLHRIMVHATGDVCALIGRMGVFGLSAVVWDGESGENVTARMSSTASYTVVDGDYETVRTLRQWIKEEKVTSVPISVIQDTPSDLVTFSRFPRGKYRSVVGRVIGLWEYSTNSGTCLLMRVTDGTRPHDDAFKLFVGSDDKAKCLYIDSTINQIAGNCVADMFVYDQYMSQANALKQGDFVSIINVHLALIQNGKYCLAFTVHGGNKGQRFGRGIFRLETSSAQANVVQSRLDDLSQNAPVQTPDTSMGARRRVEDRQQPGTDQPKPRFVPLAVQYPPDPWSAYSQDDHLPNSWSASSSQNPRSSISADDGSSPPKRRHLGADASPDNLSTAARTKRGCKESSTNT